MALARRIELMVVKTNGVIIHHNVLNKKDLKTISQLTDKSITQIQAKGSRYFILINFGTIYHIYPNDEQSFTKVTNQKMLCSYISFFLETQGLCVGKSDGLLYNIDLQNDGK